MSIDGRPIMKAIESAARAVAARKGLVLVVADEMAVLRDNWSDSFVVRFRHAVEVARAIGKVMPCVIPWDVATSGDEAIAAWFELHAGVDDGRPDGFDYLLREAAYEMGAKVRGYGGVL